MKYDFVLKIFKEIFEKGTFVVLIAGENRNECHTIYVCGGKCRVKQNGHGAPKLVLSCLKLK